MLCAGSLLAQPYIIKGPTSPKPYESTAMRELTDYLAKRIDGKLAIGGKSPITFHVGDTELAKQHKLLSTELPDEEWHIKSVGDQVILNGGGTRGALYATYHFLEDFCDIHWWSDYEEHVPTASSMDMDSLNQSGKPMFIYRDIFRSHKPANSMVTAVRVRLNRDGDTPIPLSHGGSLTYGTPAHCHTYDKYLPFSKYGKEHPEWYSLVNGKRVGGQYQGQLCITNPELRKVILQKILDSIEKDKNYALQHGLSEPKIYDVSMNDNRKRCECADCKAEEEKYNPSGLTLNFVNWIAAEVAKKHPALFISTLAYYYNEPPPKGGVKAADNVIVKLCDTRTTQAASILEPCNNVFLEYLTQWKMNAKNLFIWDYAIVFQPYTTGLPFASELHYGDLYKTYYENNVSGVFWEHERPHLADFYELKFFVETKLFENPHQDIQKIITTFMTKYYGSAAEQIMEYRKTIDEIRRKNNGFIGCNPATSDYSYITDSDIVKLQNLFDRAEIATTEDSTRLARVRHARAGLDRLNCQRRNVIASHGMGNNDKRIDAREAYARLQKSWKAWIEGWQCKNKAKMYNELDAELAMFSLASRKPHIPVPKEFEDKKLYDVYAPMLQSHDRDNVLLVDDAESPVGQAMRSNADISEYLSLPFVIGVYDSDAKKEPARRSFDKPVGKGYNWYNFGKKVCLPKNGYIFMTRLWTIQLSAKPSEFSGKEFNDIWFSVKFTGPKFFDDEQGKNYIYIDRILLLNKEN